MKVMTIPCGGDSKIRIIPIDFDMGLDEDLECEDDFVISDCVTNINHVLKRRHFIATLLRDLRRFSNDELPTYARFPKVSFAPQFGSEETEKYFRDEIANYNSKIRREFREEMIKTVKEYYDKLTEESRKIWQNASTIVSGKNLTKLNEQVEKCKEKMD